MSVGLARFQDAMAEILLRPQSAPSVQVGRIAAQPGLAVYRNTVMKGCIDALQANYPAVERLVGEEWFRAAAAIYVRAEPPREPTLVQYGAGFADFLARFEPAAELPYLPDVASLDRYWTEAHCARSERALDPAVLAHCPPDALGEAILHPHPAARWSWFADAPLYTIWSRNREAQFEAREIEWRGEGALITRPTDGVRWTELEAAGCAFLDACAAGEPLAVAAEAALRVRGDGDLAKLMSSLLRAGAFCGLQLDNLPTFKGNAT